jgi:hypothetical protein
VKRTCTETGAGRRGSGLAFPFVADKIAGKKVQRTAAEPADAED